jgi:N-carbamoyl-L-amino-acid hydrolase
MGMKLLERIDELSKIGLTDEGVCRKSGSKEDQEARDLVVRWMMEDGLTVQNDEHGNIIGRLDGEGPPIVTGSHIDTVATAGKYDGVLGVLAGLEVARTLKGSLKSPLEVIVFDDEEDTMRGSIGYTKDKPDIKAFLEVHVEQGPVLDVQQLDIGVVTGIVGQRRCSFTVNGKENHAGTTPMGMRDDALYKASELVVYVSDMANEMYDGLVATVGHLNVSPNAFSVIPGRVDLTLQIRDLSVENMEGFVENVSNMFELDYKVEHSSNPAICDEGIKEIIKSVSQDLDLKHIEMPSRASHDAQNFTFCPMGMIFVPSIGGVSHSPLERTSDKHCEDGVRVLTEVIRKVDQI